jgi:hypothetical protein
MTETYRSGSIKIYIGDRGRYHYAASIKGQQTPFIEQCRLGTTYAQALQWAKEYIDRALS